MLGAQGLHQIELAGAGYAGHLGAQSPRNLHGVAPYAAGGTDDEHRLTRLDATVVDQRLQSCGARPRESWVAGRGRAGALLYLRVRVFHGEPVLTGDAVLGERAPREAVDLV